jgi:hypothetical protein
MDFNPVILVIILIFRQKYDILLLKFYFNITPSDIKFLEIENIKIKLII